MRSRAGFTLVELMVALVISGLLLGVIFQMLMGQSRFVSVQSARQEVQQNSRGALELIASELRNVPAGAAGGIQAADRNSVTVRVPRIWGVICNVPNATFVDVAFPAGLGVALDGDASAGRPWPGLVARLSPASWSASTPVSSVGAAGSTCASAPLEVGVERRSFSVGSTAGLAVGQPVYLYDPVAYRTATLVDPPGLWIQRLVGTNAADYRTLAGPIVPGDPATVHGLRFKYYDAAGAPIAIPAGGLSGAALANVARVAVAVHTRSDQAGLSLPQDEADSTAVFLRN